MTFFNSIVHFIISVTVFSQTYWKWVMVKRFLHIKNFITLEISNFSWNGQYFNCNFTFL